MVTHARLRRRTEHRLVAGVAGAVADRLNASVGFVRAFMAIAALWVVPWAVALYALAALLIPPRGSNRPDWDNVVGLSRLGLVLVVPAAAFYPSFVVNEPKHGPPGWWIAYFAVLAAGAVALLSADYRRGRARTRAEARGVVLAALPVAISSLALVALLVAVHDVRWERFVPLVAVVGAGALLAATWRGAGRAFVAPALMALAVAGVVVAVDARLDGGVGDRSVTPGVSGGDRIVVRRAVGDVDLNLVGIARGGRDVVVEASVGIGTLHVSLPRRARVVLDTTVGKGRITPYALGGVDAVDGFDQRLARTARPDRTRGAIPTVHLRASAGVGDIELDGPNMRVEEPS